MHPTFTGIWPALITPFHDGAVDHAALRRLVLRFQRARVSGLAVCATTGEAGTLSPDERLAVLDTVVDSAPGLPIVMGLAGINPHAVLGELKEIATRPIAGILVPPPSYVRPSQAALVRFFTDIADAAQVPVIVYNIPYRTGVKMELETIRAIARHPRVAAIKDCGGDLALTMQLIADGELDVLTGEDLQIFTTLCLGGAGAIAASAHVRPDLFVALAEAIAAGELATARGIFYQLRPVIEALFAEPNPAPLKAALAALGLIHEEVRAPMLTVSPGLRQALGEHVRDLELLELTAAAAR